MRNTLLKFVTHRLSAIMRTAVAEIAARTALEILRVGSFRAEGRCED